MNKYLVLVLVPALLGGCASFFHPKVEDGELASRAAFALDVPRDSIRISDVAVSGGRTDFTATTAKGVRHACYVTSVRTLVERSVSDAVCNAGHGAGGKSCNALLHSAGKC